MMISDFVHGHGPQSIGARTYAFVDLSNIYYGRFNVARNRGEDPMRVRIHAEHLGQLLGATGPDGRMLTVAAGDVPSPVLERFRSVGDVETRERGLQTRSEQANDELIQNRILQLVLDRPPGSLVLATGDGAGSATGHGFIPTLDAARRQRWSISVASWGSSLNRKLADWATRTGAGLIDLDDYYYAITFELGGRMAQAVHGTGAVTGRQRP